MFKMFRKQIKLSILMTVILTILISTSAFASSTNVRLSGADRYETSSKIALNGWTQSDYAVLALGEDYPDALCSAPLAGKYKAPILLTQKNSIPSSTLNVITQLGVKNIFIIGGTGVISSAVENQLTSMNITTTRLFGQNRYETDIAVAKQLNNATQIAVVTGEDYADALSIAPIAVKLNMPIILVAHDYIPQAVKDYINNNQSITKTYVIGKGTSISNEDGLSNVIEINGQDKYQRNIAIISTFKSNLDFSSFYLATGENFADALSGSVLAGMSGNPLMLVGNDIANQKNLLQLVAPNANIKILGGIGAVSDDKVGNIDGTSNSDTTIVPPTPPISTVNSRQNPANVGSLIYATYTDYSKNVFKSEITVKSIIRGDSAWSMIHSANMFNDVPKDGYEYILANISVKLDSSPDENTQYSLSTYDFTLVSSSGSDYKRESIVIPSPELNAKLYVGAEAEGYVAFLVPKSDIKPLMVYGRSYNGTGGVWFSAYTNDTINNSTTDITDQNTNVNSTYFPELSTVLEPVGITYDKVIHSNKTVTYAYDVTKLSKIFVADYFTLLKQNGWTYYKGEYSDDGTPQIYYQKGSHMILVSTIAGAYLVIMGDKH